MRQLNSYVILFPQRFVYVRVRVFYLLFVSLIGCQSYRRNALFDNCFQTALKYESCGRKCDATTLVCDLAAIVRNVS